MAEIAAKKPRLMLTCDDTSVSRILPCDIRLEPKYLVQIDELNQTVFIAIPATNPARKEEMSLIGKIVLELNLCPAEWKRSIVRLVGSSNNPKVYEGGTQYLWQRSNPTLSTVIVVKKITNNAGSASKIPNPVDQRRQQINLGLAQPSPSTTHTQSVRLLNHQLIPQRAALRQPTPIQTSLSKSVVPSGKSITCRMQEAQEITTAANSQATALASEDLDLEIKTEIEEDMDSYSVQDPVCDDPPFKIIDWSKVDLPLNKDVDGHVYFSQTKQGAGQVELLQRYHKYLQNHVTFPHDGWSVLLLSLTSQPSKRVLSIFETSHDFEPITILRSIQLFSDGTVIIGIKGKDCTDAFLKKISIEKNEDLQELVLLLSTSTNCVGSVGFDIIGHCDSGIREGKIWFSKNCSKVIFDENGTTCSGCQLLRNILRVEKAKIYREVHEMEQDKFHATLANSDNVQPQNFELGKAIYDLIGGFWDELKIEEEAKANKPEGENNPTPSSI